MLYSIILSASHPATEEKQEASLELKDFYEDMQKVADFGPLTYSDMENNTGFQGSVYINEEKFIELCRRGQLRFDTENTMGMIGACVDGQTCLSLIPAISFTCDIYFNDVYVSLYVCPFPETDEEKAMYPFDKEDSWQRVVEYVKKNFLG